MKVADLEIKRLGVGSLGAALHKAEIYRALNQAEEAESICRDILDAEPTHQGALRTLGLATTDQFVTSPLGLIDEALEIFAQLTSEYERVYYAGVAWERFAKAELGRAQPREAAHAFERALSLYEHAQTLAGADDPDPILRWNRCVRAVRANQDVARAMLAPDDLGPASQVLLGD